MKKIIVANWKLNPKSLKEARTLFLRTREASRIFKTVETVVSVPAAYLAGLPKSSRVLGLGAQDVFWETEGAYTGQISARMVRDVGAAYVILGHSERREYAGDTDEIIAKKVKVALQARLRPILCVGERVRAHDGSSAVFVKDQLKKSLSGIPKALSSRLIITYEPVWAISSHKPTTLDTPEATLEMTLYVRRVLHTLFGAQAAKRIPVLYGGSVNAKNAAAFLSHGGVDGLLVGKASLEVKEFAAIIRVAAELV